MMASANQLPPEPRSPSPVSAAPRKRAPASPRRSIFVGPGGLRAGWRLLIFFIIVAVLLGAAVLIRFGSFHAAREANRGITPTPLLLGGSDALSFLTLCVAAWIMGRIERRPFSIYGLPFARAFRNDFWFGSLLGFLAISGTLAVMFLLHGFRISGLEIHGLTIVTSLVGWAVAFLLVGLFEEFLFRGYVQFTLASGIGFWPAAFVISGLFGLGHAFNPGETPVGSAAVVMFGLLLCLFLRRTGNLWCAVGFHAAYDWGQMFYGVPDSGIVPYHNLLHSSFSGSPWLTGGSVGPEASVLTPLALLAIALIFSRYYRERRYEY